MHKVASEFSLGGRSEGRPALPKGGRWWLPWQHQGGPTIPPEGVSGNYVAGEWR